MQQCQSVRQLVSQLMIMIMMVAWLVGCPLYCRPARPDVARHFILLESRGFKGHWL